MKPFISLPFVFKITRIHTKKEYKVGTKYETVQLA